MKYPILFATFLLICTNVFSQAKEGVVNYQNKPQPAAVIDMPYSASVVETAIEKYLDSKGAKGRDSRGFKTFKNVKLDDASTKDLFFKLERKSQNESTVYLFMVPTNQGQVTDSTENTNGVEQAKVVLASLAPTAEASNLDLQVKQQEDAVNKAEKRLKNLMDDASDLSKRKSNIEQKIAENQQLQEKQKVEIEKQRQQLSNLINRRRS